MDLIWLRDFEALAEFANFSRAAEARHVTQPAFSRRIRALEDWAGTALFERGAQPIELTEAGRRLRPLLADVARRLDEARAEAGAAGSGSLRFAATHALSFSFFPVWLRGLDPLRSAVTIQLVSDGLEACERLMLAGRAEFLLCHHHGAAPSQLAAAEFDSRAVGRDRLRLVCVSDERGLPRYGPDDRTAPTLGYGAGSGLGRILGAVGAAPSRPVFTSHLAATLRTMALEGAGLAWLPESLIGDDLLAKRLVPAGARSGDVEVEIRMFRSHRATSRTGRAFWDGVLDIGS